MSRNVRLTQVKAIQTISPHLKRFVLSGNELDDFPTEQDGAHVKVLLPHRGQKLPNLDINGENPAIKRSYTIREFDAPNKQLVLDFVINRHQGPATNWANSAKVGDYLGIAGPGVRKLTDFNANSYVLIGDLTSVNAVNGYAKFISPNAELIAIVSVPTQADVIAMNAGKHLKVHWHVADKNPSALPDMVYELVKDMDKNSQVFIGLEASEVRAVKSLLLHELDFNRLNIHATAYWKQGMNADQLGAERKRNPL